MEYTLLAVAVLLLGFFVFRVISGGGRRNSKQTAIEKKRQAVNKDAMAALAGIRAKGDDFRVIRPGSQDEASLAEDELKRGVDNVLGGLGLSSSPHSSLHPGGPDGI